MMNSSEPTPDSALANLASMRDEGERLAKQFKAHRDDLRAEAIHAVTEQGISVAKAAATAGIDRRTLTVWLQVHNAEVKGRQKSK